MLERLLIVTPYFLTLIQATINIALDPIMLEYITNFYMPLPLDSMGLKLAKPSTPFHFLSWYTIFDSIPGSDCTRVGYKVGFLVK